jgi:voltage-gated potassium channel Kch
MQYLAAIYWALQTLTTVGFGDIVAVSTTEKIITIFWMIFGIGFYSFTIGNLS